MTMGRKRKHDTGLPKNVYFRHGAFYYVHRTGKWERLGTDVAEAKRQAVLYNDPETAFGTMAWFLDAFVVACKNRVEKGDMAQRTYEDYRKDVEPLKLVFGKYMPAFIESKHVAEYLDMGLANNRPVRANREKSCLSACFSWLIRTGQGNVKTNPCIGIRRNKETARKRYVENDELAAVWNIAVKQVRGLLDLIYLTLQRPQDVLTWSAANIVIKQEPDGTKRRVIRNVQNKTGASVDIAITPEIDNVLQYLRVPGTLPAPGMTFLHRMDGRPYTYSGLTSMLTRYIDKTGVKSFGFYDMKGKGATDMWLAGVPLEQIQALCGHGSVKTTEIYVKSRWRGTVEPNQVREKMKNAG